MTAIRKYPYSFANYPTGFKGCVVGPTKICMQFSNPQVKLRLHEQSGDELHKVPGTKDCYVPVIVNGVEVLVTAVGCQMPVLEQAQFELIHAYRAYYSAHKDMYRKTYNKMFSEFITKLKYEIDSLNDFIVHEEVKQNGCP